MKRIENWLKQPSNIIHSIDATANQAAEVTKKFGDTIESLGLAEVDLSAEQLAHAKRVEDLIEDELEKHVGDDIFRFEVFDPALEPDAEEIIEYIRGRFSSWDIIIEAGILDWSFRAR